MPCTEVFDRQDAAYRAHVLPSGGARLAIEAATSDSWWRYIGGNGRVIGIDRFGQSAPAKTLFEYYGITAEAVSAASRELLA